MEKYVYYDFSNKKYLKEICKFTNKIQSVKNAKKEINAYNNIKYDNSIKGLWAIFGKGEGNNNKLPNVDFNKWICLEVGSNENIKSELRGILNDMISKPGKISKSSTYHPNLKLYEFNTYMDRASIKYRTMFDMCNQFVIYEIDVDEYIKENGTYDIVNYAEVKFAHDNKALFWNPSPAVYGNQERHIYETKFKN